MAENVLRPEIKSIIDRWRIDLGMCPPEMADWRWMLIGQELQNLIDDAVMAVNEDYYDHEDYLTNQ